MPEGLRNVVQIAFLDFLPSELVHFEDASIILVKLRLIIDHPCKRALQVAPHRWKHPLFQFSKRRSGRATLV